MKEDTLYRDILSEAWRLTWKNRSLWILGFLAIFWGGIGAYQSLNRTFDNVESGLEAPLSAGRAVLPSLDAFTLASFATFLAVAVVILAAVATVILFAVSGRGGLIVAIAKRREGKSIRVKAMLKKGLQSFWPLLGIGVLMRLDIPLYFWIMTPLASYAPSGLALTLYALAFIILTVVSLILALLGIYASALILLENRSLGKALREAFALFTGNWLTSLEMALILYFVSILTGLAVLVALFALGIPFVFVGLIVVMLKIPAGIWFVLIPGMVAYIVFLAVAASALVTFQYAAWTILYLRIRERSAVSKVMRLTARFAHILHRKLV